ncbi:MAG: hypothetical protein CVU39_24900 [Chloroflexi bacterium HGW-Chloroflexi-10]|nr:MAG: hypothetical protein CVU39_24900 [Chloroflexi bacterium HGW-Chloroflexi-10]
MNEKHHFSLVAILRFLNQPVLLLFWVCLFTYGFFIPLMGLFWDEMVFHWVSEVYGIEGLARYFSTNRPIWGMIYQLTTSILGKEIWVWQIFGIFWRWVASTGVYFIMKQVWGKQKEARLLASILFIIYPGFHQQYLAMLYGHFFLVLSAFFYSIGLSLLAIRKKMVWLHIPALFLSAVNLLTMEYFFMLELIRPLFMWFILYGKEKFSWAYFKSLILHYSPYILIILSAAYWRLFIYTSQTRSYQFNLVTQFQEQPLIELGLFLLTIFKDLWITIFAAWGKVFQFSETPLGLQSLVLYLGIMVLFLIFLFVVFFILRKGTTTDSRNSENWIYQCLFTGIISAILAGIPFWFTKLPIGLTFSTDRFTIPFFLSFSLIWVSILYLLPVKPWQRLSIFILMACLAGGVQTRNGIEYQRDWKQQSRFFWQLMWRAPGLERNTILFTDILPLQYYSDNSLTAALNWIYDSEKIGTQIPYVLYYPSVRPQRLSEISQGGQPNEHDLLVGTFFGQTDHSIAMLYQTAACLRILDPEIEADNIMVPQVLRNLLHLTDPNRIQAENNNQPPAYLYLPEPPHNWCYYFEKADLARQFEDWEAVVRIAQTAFSLGDSPNDPAERMPFIEAYAHTAHWDLAMEQTQLSAAITPAIHPVLCNLWQRIERQTPDSPEKLNTLQSLYNQLECNLEP